MYRKIVSGDGKNSNELILAAKNCSRAMEELVKLNIGFIKKQCPYFRQNSVFDYDDIIQEAIIGFMKGVEKFDITKGFTLNTYSAWWIKQRVQSFLYANVGMARTPNYVYEIISRFNKIKLEYQVKYSDNPTVEKVLAFGDFEEGDKKHIRKYLKLESFENPSDSEFQMSLLWDDLTKVKYQNVNKLLEILKPKERIVVSGRIIENLSLREIGEKLGLTKEGIRLIELRSFEKIRKYCRKNKLSYDDFVFIGGNL